MEINNKKSLIFLIAIILFFVFIIKERALTYSLNSDENAYFYMAKIFSQGSIPYKDFFFAHEPLQLIILSVIIKVFGFNFIILKFMPVLTLIILSFFLFKIISMKSDNETALIGVALFLFEYSLLRISTQSVGIDLALLFLIIGFYCFIKEKNIFSGLFLGLSAISSLLSIVPSAVIFIYSLIKSRKTFLKLLLGFSIFLLVNLIFLIITNNFYWQVYLYHLLKPEQSFFLYRFIVMLTAIEKNPVLFFSLVLFLFFYKKLKNQTNNLSLFIIFGYITFLLLLKRPFIFYYILIFPFLAILSSFVIDHFLKKISSSRIKALLLIIIIAFTLSYSIISFKIDTKNDKNSIGIINELSEYIKENSDENDFIFGDYYIVPLLSLITKRDIALNEIDTNLMRFQSVSNINNLIYGLENEKRQKRLKYIIIESNRDLAYSREFVEFTKKCSLALKKQEYYIFDCQ